MYVKRHLILVEKESWTAGSKTPRGRWLKGMRIRSEPWWVVMFVCTAPFVSSCKAVLSFNSLLKSDTLQSKFMEGIGDWRSIDQINSSEQRTSVEVLGIFSLT